ncbi:IS481 family transposase [Siccirubricoccus sp. G192]|uniref:IS481 family transposase n=1 Tax=Siccirubricoccus sp. G192 TaxID=2849651 RepID=UPI001C2B7D21|nr:IS481 family transposase [Siccirubricoccus sp. G192]MBV1795999.1 IS481 family transposase [Siccirubricoccus sp. G192]MBV1798906.1 IS481 family transposase [Siccirubricoccus sp. G192]
MDAHENARATPHSRMLIVARLRGGQSVAQVAASFGITPRTVRKWRDRHAAEGEAGLRDRSSRPSTSPPRLSAERTAQIEALRRQRRSGPAIARQLGLPGSTVGLALRRLGLNRLAALDLKPEVIRYERAHPGELIHIDIKKLGRIDGIGHRITGDRTGQSNGRGKGWEYLHVAIDDASRLAFTAMMPDERKDSAVAFLDAALGWFTAHGVTVQRVMTDNGSAYKSHAFAKAIASHALKHKRTRPYTPKTNGKAERFIQTSIREWAYATPFQTSADRTKAMHPWLHGYNTARPHAAIKGKPPLSRIPKDNLLGNDS